MIPFLVVSPPALDRCLITQAHAGIFKTEEHSKSRDDLTCVREAVFNLNIAFCLIQKDKNQYTASEEL